MASVGIATGTGANVAVDSGTRDSITENVQLIRQENTLLKTYAASNIAAPGLTGILMLLGGSSTATVKLRRVMISGTATTAAFIDIGIEKYSTAASGGTTTALTIAQLDSNNGAATATCVGYSAAPTAGTAAGIVTASKLLANASGTLTYQAPPLVIDFGLQGCQCPTLRGTSQQIAIVSTTSLTGGSLDLTMWWTEETNSF